MFFLLHRPYCPEPPKASGRMCFVVASATAVLAMSLQGFEAMPDDTMLPWLGDNDDQRPGSPQPTPSLSPTRAALQAMMDGPMIETGIGR